MYTERSHALDPYAPREAWPPVLAAIEEAMDVPGLAPTDRGKLAELYEAAQPYAGERVIHPADASGERGQLLESLRKIGGMPTEAERGAWREAQGIADGPGGLHELRPLLGKGRYRVCAVLRDHDILTVAQVAAASDAELLSMRGIGPVALRDLREAVATHQALQAAAR